MTYINTMGVMNITPNSFSDGGEFNDSDSLSKRFHHYQNKENFIYDFGAESTAPFNDPIGLEQEKQRLSLCFDLLKDSTHCLVSLDTYRGACAHWFFGELKKLGFKEEQLFWNDVSGQWDDEVQSFLNEFPKSNYIFSHNLCPERSEASHHMDYVRENENIVTGVIEHFKQIPRSSRVYFDPCFGFSKSFEQNWELANNLSRVFQSFDAQRWVIGISKKQFLRRFLSDLLKNDLSHEQLLLKSEWIHLELLKSFILQANSCSGVESLTFRVHDPDIVDIAAFNG